MQIRTSYYAKPGPDRQYDWCAWDDDRWDVGEPGAPMGWAATEQQAVDALMDLLDEERMTG